MNSGICNDGVGWVGGVLGAVNIVGAGGGCITCVAVLSALAFGAEGGPLLVGLWGRYVCGGGACRW